MSNTNKGEDDAVVMLPITASEKEGTETKECEDTLEIGARTNSQEQESNASIPSAMIEKKSGDDNASHSADKTIGMDQSDNDSAGGCNIEDADGCVPENVEKVSEEAGVDNDSGDVSGDIITNSQARKNGQLSPSNVITNASKSKAIVKKSSNQTTRKRKRNNSSESSRRTDLCCEPSCRRRALKETGRCRAHGHLHQQPSQPPAASVPAEDRQRILSEVRQHLNLLKEFEGVISEEEMRQRKHHLFMLSTAALPTLSPALSRKRRQQKKQQNHKQDLLHNDHMAQHSDEDSDYLSDESDYDAFLDQIKNEDPTGLDAQQSALANQYPDFIALVPPASDSTTPKPDDVFFDCTDHPGNKQFKTFAAKYRKDYTSANITIKRRIIYNLIKDFRATKSRPRFLRFRSDSKWYEIGDELAFAMTRKTLEEVAAQNDDNDDDDNDDDDKEGGDVDGNVTELESASVEIQKQKDDSPPSPRTRKERKKIVHKYAQIIVNAQLKNLPRKKHYGAATQLIRDAQEEHPWITIGMVKGKAKRIKKDMKKAAEEREQNKPPPPRPDLEGKGIEEKTELAKVEITNRFKEAEDKSETSPLPKGEFRKVHDRVLKEFGLLEIGFSCPESPALEIEPAMLAFAQSRKDAGQAMRPSEALKYANSLIEKGSELEQKIKDFQAQYGKTPTGILGQNWLIGFMKRNQHNLSQTIGICGSKKRDQVGNADESALTKQEDGEDDISLTPRLSF